MAEILVRKLEDAILVRLKARAKANNRSVGAELREIIADALKPQAGMRPPLSSLVGAAGKGRSQVEVDRYIRDLREEWDC